MKAAAPDRVLLLPSGVLLLDDPFGLDAAGAPRSAAVVAAAAEAGPVVLAAPDLGELPAPTQVIELGGRDTGNGTRDP